jgi:hypothetical protein
MLKHIILVAWLTLLSGCAGWTAPAGSPLDAHGACDTCGRKLGSPVYPTPSGTGTVLTWNAGSSGAYSWAVGSGVTWANDLSPSTNTNQYVATLSGNSSATAPVTLLGTYLGLNGSTTYPTLGQLRASESGSGTDIIGTYSSSATEVALSIQASGLYVGSDFNFAHPVSYLYNVANNAWGVYCVACTAWNIYTTPASGTVFFGGSSSAAPFQFNYSTATTPYIQSGTSATSFTLGTNKSGAVTNINVDANLSWLQGAGGTQNSVALGANLASVGHFRFPQAFVAMARNSSNTGDEQIYKLQNDVLQLGNVSGTLSFTQIAGSASCVYDVGTSVTTDCATQNFDDGTGNAAIVGTMAHTGATSLQIGTGVTGFQLNWAAAAGAGANTSIIGQAAGGTNSGGQVILQGGSHAGAGTVDGSVKITTPLNGGFSSVVSASPTNLTIPQSDSNFLILTAGAAGAFTVNVIRQISDTSCMWIKNSSAQTATIAFLTGGTVTMATLTSALVCSDGANLQKVMTGT